MNKNMVTKPITKQNEQPKEQPKEQMDDIWVVSGWINTMKDADGNAREDIFRVNISGIVHRQTLEKLLDGQVSGCPIKTTNKRQD